MTVGLKIVLFAINLFCLIGTIVYPSNITPISLLPCWISIGYWLYERVINTQKDCTAEGEQEENENSISNRTRIAYISLLMIFAMFVLLFVSIGFFFEYDIETDIPSYVKKEDVYLPFDLDLPYSIFQLLAVAGYIFIAGAELVYMIYKQNISNKAKRYKENDNTPSQDINKQINQL